MKTNKQKKRVFFLSVITCTKDSDRFLAASLKSIEGQTFRNFEHIFVDGYSSDDTLRIIKNYKFKNPDISVKIIQSEPLGVANAMNIGIKNANGEVIYFLHSDDYLISKDSLKKVGEIFMTNDINWIIGYNVSIREKLKIVKHVFRNKLLFSLRLDVGNFISHANTFLKKSVFEKYGYFDENYKISMDYEYWLRINGKEQYLLVDEAFAVFRIHDVAISSNKRNLLLRKSEDLVAFKKNISRNKLIVVIRCVLFKFLEIATYIKNRLARKPFLLNK